MSQRRSLIDRQRQFLIDEARRAQQAGHTIDLEERRPKSAGRTSNGQLMKVRKGSHWVAWCSCGWESNAMSQKLQALAKAMLHLGQASADLDCAAEVPMPPRTQEQDHSSREYGVSLPSFVAPSVHDQATGF